MWRGQFGIIGEVKSRTKYAKLRSVFTRKNINYSFKS